MTLVATLGEIRTQIQADEPAYTWDALRRSDLERDVWAAFWRLVHASLEPGSALPERLSWNDRLTLLLAMYDLNDLEAAEGKLRGLTDRTVQTLTRMQMRLTRTTQAQTTPRWTST